MNHVLELFPEQTQGWARVAVDRGIDIAGMGLTYAYSPDLDHPPIGTPVLVPLGRGNTPTPGWIVQHLADEPGAAIKHILSRRDGPTLPEDLVDLGLWMARYYMAPPGPTLSGMVPAPVIGNVGLKTRRYLDLPRHPPDDATPTGPAQRAVLEVITERPPDQRPIERSALKHLADIATTGPIDTLVRHGLLIEERRQEIASTWSFEHLDVAAPPTPTPAQQQIIDDIAHRLDDGFSTHLLLGVTGAGKTEVYLRLIEQVLARGRSVLVLVPEIALTPQTGARLARRFPDEQVAILHSALPAAARHAAWRSIAEGRSRVVLGARSAVFAPLPIESIGLIVVDEEHDGSFKQDSSPRYHGRDVAIRRAQMADCPILLCSATPSLESWFNATDAGRSTLHRLTERAPGLTTPRIQVVDITKDRRNDGQRGGSLGPTLRNAVDAALRQSQQVILMLNRRGWATFIACARRQCGWSLQCAHCDVTMVYHRRGDLPTGGLVRCHHCTREVRLPRRCPECSGNVSRLGHGTQRIEEELLDLWPDLLDQQSMARVDSDTMRTARDVHETLRNFQAGRVRVLLGTQMIAKGLDVAGVGLVGVIDADTALNMPDFRASERTFQLVHQVTGRVGRSSTPGTAVIQTMNADAPAVALAVSGRFEDFARHELDQRRLAQLPPVTRMARVVAQHASLPACQDILEHTCDALRVLAGSDTQIIGPMVCPLSRVKGRHRRELLISCPTAGALASLLQRALDEGVLSDAALMIDVDPISLL